MAELSDLAGGGGIGPRFASNVPYYTVITIAHVVAPISCKDCFLSKIKKFILKRFILNYVCKVVAVI